MKMKRKLLWTGGVIVGLIVIGLVVLFFTLNSIVRSQVEKSATASLKVQTDVGAATVSPFSGNLGLSGLQIASPEGFSGEKMFTLGDVAVNVSYGQLFGQPKKITAITIDKPHLLIEQKGGKLNVMELVNNLPKTEDKAPADGESMKLVIGQLDVTGTTVELRPGLPGFDRPINIAVPAISLKNIGNGDGNQTGEELGRVLTDVIRALADKAAESDQIPPELRQLMKLDIDQIKGQVIDRAGGELDKVKEKVGGEVNKSLGGLLDKVNKPKDKK